MMQQLRQLKEQLGWQGISGIAMLLLAGAFNFLALQPLEQETSFMHTRLNAVQAKTSAQSRTVSLGDRQKELGEFFDSLPVESDVTDILASLSAIAEESGVEIRQAEYRLDEKKKSRLEYGIFLPIQGGYANVRHFVFRVLAEHPAIALDQINFQRDRVADSALKAEIHMTIFFIKSN